MTPTPHQQPRNRIRLPDVAEHLARVDQIVDGDEVEARAELVPEEPLRERREDQAEDRHEEEDRGERRMQPAGKDALGQQREVDERRHGDPRSQCGVLQQADPEGAADRARMPADRLPTGHQQCESRREGDRDHQRCEDRDAAEAMAEDSLPERKASCVHRSGANSGLSEPGARKPRRG